MTSPHTSARAADSARAALLGYQSSSPATERVRRRVTSESPGRLFSANETAPLETPARRAISEMVTRLPGTWPPDTERFLGELLTATATIGKRPALPPRHSQRHRFRHWPPTSIPTITQLTGMTVIPRP